MVEGRIVEATGPSISQEISAIVRILTSSSSIDPERLTAAGKGEFVPIQSNSISAGRSANRRIEIILTPKLYDLYELLED